MAEFRRVQPGSITESERLEDCTRVIDPVFSVAWQAARRMPRLSLFLEVQRDHAWYAHIDRDGLVWKCHFWRNGLSLPIRFLSQLTWRTPEGFLIFGEASDIWLRQLTSSSKSPIFVADFEQIGQAAQIATNLIYEDTTAVDRLPINDLRAMFAKMMDSALLAAHRMGFDADDMETERFVRVTRNGKWHLFEDWARVERGERAKPPSEAVPGSVIEIRLRSVIARPPGMLPEIVQVSA